MRSVTGLRKSTIKKKITKKFSDSEDDGDDDDSRAIKEESDGLETDPEEDD